MSMSKNLNNRSSNLAIKSKKLAVGSSELRAVRKEDLLRRSMLPSMSKELPPMGKYLLPRSSEHTHSEQKASNQ